MLFSSVGVPVRGMRSMTCGCESISLLGAYHGYQWQSSCVGEVREGGGGGVGWLAIPLKSDSKTISLTNHQWDNENCLVPSSQISTHKFIHFLTLIDKLDIFLMCRSESLFLLVVCWESQSRVMVLFTIRTVENYLGCRKAEEYKEKSICQNSPGITANTAPGIFYFLFF